ncbi:hypothetical protein MWH25_10945 [Natroniella acetigena]|uniref:ORC-CDC6 family AAA ATPase n=1 Tax=Natroniella acetigena TaxID=52004 RepID=UPI00200A4905|nr:hypothetical protein [Natroniella acetigena]MCK8828249.1 hypothetical protein [Natroniella acetigena]
MVIEVNSSLVGPLHADSFSKKKDFINNYVSLRGESSIYKDPLLGSVINGDKVILSGVRGTGKTMILKTGEAILKKNLNEKLENDEDDLILPVYVTYSGFKKDVSLENEMELASDELKTAREIFRGYFYMTLLDSVLDSIENMGLDKNVDFNLFGLRTKLGIKREIENAIKTFKRLGFREVLESKKKGVDIGVKIKQIELAITPGMSSKEDITEVRLDDMQRTNLFKQTIDSICSVYNLSKIHYLFDEVYYLKYLQPEFFDILFGFRNYTNITFSISSYPTFMDYGNEFDIPDDAREVSVSSSLYKPDKYSFEKALIKLVESRIKKYGEKRYENVISNETLEHLILLTNGNPRMLLQSIDYIWQQNNGKKIIVKNITSDLIYYMVKSWYLRFMKNQARRYKTSIDKIEEFLKIIVDRLKKNNERNEIPTSFFLISDEIHKHFSSTINLLHYFRMIDEYKIGDFGGGDLKKGQTYLLNPMVGIYELPPVC